jgi:methionine synthase I (cobalamin-dependent)
MKNNGALPKVDSNTYSVNPALADKKYTLTEESQQLRSKVASLVRKVSQKKTSSTPSEE